METHTKLIFIESKGMTVDQYIREMLDLNIIPFGSLVGNNFLFMHDNSYPHVATIVFPYLDNTEIRRMN